MRDVPDDVILGPCQKRGCRATVSSTTPREELRWPPVLDTAIDYLPTKLMRELFKVLDPQILHVRGVIDAVKDGLDFRARIGRPPRRAHAERGFSLSCNIIPSKDEGANADACQFIKRIPLRANRNGFIAPV